MRKRIIFLSFLFFLSLNFIKATIFEAAENSAAGDKKYINDLRSENNQVVAEAIEYIVKNPYQSEGAVPELIALLKKDMLFQKSGKLISLGDLAAVALIKIGEPAVPSLVSVLKDDDEGVKDKAATALIKIGQPAAEYLLDILQETQDQNLKYEIIFILGRIKDNRIVPRLITTLILGKDIKLREFAAEALSNLGDPRALEAFILGLKDSDPVVRRYSAEGLSKLNDEKSLEPLIEALNDHDWDVRANAAEALGNLKNIRAQDALINALKDKDRNVRKNAAMALAKINDERGIDAVIDSFQNDSELIEASIYILERKKDPRIINRLIDFLDSQSQYLKQSSRKAIVKCSDAAVKPLIDALYLSVKPEKKEEIVNLLVKIGKPSASSLIESLRYYDDSVRRLSAQALGKIGQRSAVWPLIAALDDKNWTVRYEAVESLGQIGDPIAIEHLIYALEKESEASVKDKIVSVLINFTGKDFGSNPDFWRRWYNENKAKNN